MKKPALIALAFAFAATGAVSSASAALSDRDGTIWRQADVVQVVARGGNKGGRNDGNRAGRDRKGGKVIWRIRDGKNKPFFLFRGRGDCKTQAVQRADGSVRNAWVCN